MEKANNHIDLKLIRKLCYNDPDLIADFLPSVLTEFEETTAWFITKQWVHLQSPELFRKIHQLKASMQLVGSGEGILQCQLILDNIQENKNEVHVHQLLKKLGKLILIIREEVKNYPGIQKI